MNQLRASDITFSNVRPVRLHQPKSTSSGLTVGATINPNTLIIVIGSVILGVAAIGGGTVAAIVLAGGGGGSTTASPSPSPPPILNPPPPPGFTFIRNPPPPPLPDPRHADQCIHHIGDSITQHVWKDARYSDAHRQLGWRCYLAQSLTREGFIFNTTGTMDKRNHQTISEPCPGFPQLFHDGNVS
jgi:hypothetical protein